MSGDAAQGNPEGPPGRNDRCPCGSGRKYKQCCLGRDEAAAREARARQAEAEAAAAPPADEPPPDDEPHGPHHKPSHDRPRQPGKPDAHGAAGAKKRSLPRKVGS